ncbi:MAG: metallophosphoesterase family protein [Sedimenticola sp.]
MSTKIGIFSDPHATPGPVEEAFSIFRQQQVDHILCAGDIAGYGEDLDQTVALVRQAECKAVIGNHESWYLEQMAEELDQTTYEYLGGLPSYLEMQVEGRTLYMVHASPPDSLMDGIRLLDEQGRLIEANLNSWAERLQGFEYDLLVVGHTHQVFAQRIAKTLVINPGSTLFNHSCVIVTLPDLHVEWYGLSGQAVRRSWNWGLRVSNA